MSHRPQATVLDIDGVLADVTHRVHLVESPPRRWDDFVDAADGDALIPTGAQLAREALRSGQVLILLSGRPERTRNITMRWLVQNRIEASEIHLRGPADSRPAHEFKLEVLRHLTERFNIVLFVDDDPYVIQAVNNKRDELSIETVSQFGANFDDVLYRGQELEGRT